MKEALLIFLGGGIGSIVRFFISKNLNTDLPYGTFTVNLIGSFLIGVFMAWLNKESVSEQFLLLMVVGFCGGLTTFSSFAFESMKMLQSDLWKEFLMYNLLSMVLGIGLVFLGYKVVS